MNRKIKAMLPVLAFPALILMMLAADRGIQLVRNTAVAGCRPQDLAEITDVWFETGAVETAANGQEKIVCLTFDDGPSRTTEAVLDVLRREAVPATFFVIAAENNQKYLPLIAAEVSQGCQIALHSCSHEYRKIYSGADAFWKDLEALKAAIGPYVDTDALRCLRFPGGSTNTVSRKYGGSGLMKQLKAQAEEKGYHYIDWNVCADDAVGKRKSADEVVRNVIEDAGEKTVCVVLMHDTNATASTAQALPDIIRWFRDKGYRFCTVEEMLTATAQEKPAT